MTTPEGVVEKAAAHESWPKEKLISCRMGQTSYPRSIILVIEINVRD